ncbi:VOC family protein [uncultured Roseibium sp.]|uniref:VOC family protein n=1 Tax=uncultured Roseibium sp. TaxID=1936171 RepID=UPI00262A18E3|nr:VOC family protein [uncultured Roseibium sp.]
MAKMVHSCIRVLDDVKSADWYKSAFELEIADQLDFDAFRLTYLKNETTGFELELTLNKERKSPYDLGDGYGHLAVTVADLEHDHARLEKLGIETGDIVDFAPAGRRVARFFFATDPDGYKIEVIERGGRFR